MNKNIRIAGKLVKLAKEIISSNNNIANKPGEYKNFSGIINFENKEGKILGIVENADFELSEKSGYPPIFFYSGTWENGTWINGNWYNGTWKNGIWETGAWISGTWKKGTWEDGEWKNGTWKNGTWENGTWEYGTWKNGTWKYGKWHNGTWENGTWIKGKDKNRKIHYDNPNEW